jgi:iron complex transport system substrate-binding protein
MPVFRFSALILAVVVTLPACSAPARETKPAAVVRDDFGTPVDFGKSPRRIVSLNPATTELLFSIGALPRVVGRSQWDTFPESVTTVPSLGQALRPNVEAILGARPDLVLLYASQDNRDAYDRLRRAGVMTVALRIDSIAQFERGTRLIGRITGDSVRADALVDSVHATLERVRAATASLPHPTVFIHAWDRPIIAIGGGSFQSQLLEIAGGRNVYGDIAAPSATVTLEDVVQRNPEYVFASPISAPKMRASASWRTIPAVRAGRLLVYDTLLIGRPSGNLGAAAVSLAALLHPGAVR